MPNIDSHRPSKRDLAYDYEDNKFALKSEYQKSLHKLEQNNQKAHDKLQELMLEYASFTGSSDGILDDARVLTEYKGLKALKKKILGPKTVSTQKRLETIKSQYQGLLIAFTESETYLDSIHSIAEFDPDDNPTFMADRKAKSNIKAQETIAKNKAIELNKKLKSALEIANSHKQKVKDVARITRGIPPVDAIASARPLATQVPQANYEVFSNPPANGMLSDEELKKITDKVTKTNPNPSPDNDLLAAASQLLQNTNTKTTEVKVTTIESLAKLATDIPSNNQNVSKTIYSNNDGLIIGLDASGKVVAFHKETPLTIEPGINKVVLRQPNTIYSYTVFDIEKKVQEQKNKALSPAPIPVSKPARAETTPQLQKFEETRPITAAPITKTDRGTAANPKKVNTIEPDLFESPLAKVTNKENPTDVIKLSEEQRVLLNQMFAQMLKDPKAQNLEFINSEEVKNIVIAKDKDKKTIKINNFVTNLPYSLENLIVLKSSIASGELVELYSKSKLLSVMNHTMGSFVDFLTEDGSTTTSQKPNVGPKLKSRSASSEAKNESNTADLESSYVPALGQEVNTFINKVFGIDDDTDIIQPLEDIGFETNDDPEKQFDSISVLYPVLKKTQKQSDPELVANTETTSSLVEEKYKDFLPLIEAILNSDPKIPVSKKNHIKKIEFNYKQLILKLKNGNPIVIDSLLTTDQLSILKAVVSKATKAELNNFVNHLNSTINKK
jgi:hypothetical protein